MAYRTDDEVTDGTDTQSLDILDHGLSRRGFLLRLAAAGIAVPLAAAPMDTLAEHDFEVAAATKRIAKLTWALPSQPRSLDIAIDFNTNSAVAQFLVHETLVSYSNNLKLVPALAESWSNPSPLHYVYKLRQGVKFWDGSLVTAQDVVYSLRRNLDQSLGSQIASYFATVKSVKATNSHEVTVTLKRPDPTFRFTPTLSPIYKKSVTEPQGKNYGAPGGTIMGTGPYIVQSFGSDGINLRRNPHYWGKTPIADHVQLVYIPDSASRQLAMRSGSIDGTFVVPIGESNQWQRLPNTKVLFTSGLSVAFLSFDLTTAPWNDIHVRRAFAHCWDGKGFVKAVLHGKGQPANSMVPPDMWKSLVSKAEIKRIYASLPAYPFSIAKAKAELAKSHVPQGFSASVTYPADYSPDSGQALLVLAQNLKQIGINLTVTESTLAKWIAYIYAHKDLGLQSLGYSPDYPDPADYLDVSYPSANAVPNNFNTANYRNKTIDALIDGQLKAKTRAQRVADLAEIMRISERDLPYLNLWWRYAAMAVSTKFTYRGYNPEFFTQNWVQNLVPR